MQIHVLPVSGINESLKITVDEVDPGSAVSIQVSTVDANNEAFQSKTEYTANEDGIVDTTTMIPADAKWAPADSRGVLWTLFSRTHSDFELGDLTTLNLDINIRTTGTGLGAKVQRRIREVPEIPREQLPKGFRGTAYAAAKAPGVVLLGRGNEADIPAAVLAKQGFATFAIGWEAPCDVESLCRQIRGIRLLQCIDDEPLTLIGVGRSAELALLLASMLPSAVGPVVAHSPSDVLTMEPSKGKQHPTWDETELTPISAPLLDKADLSAFVGPEVKGQPWNLRPYYDSARQHSDLDAARIPVERMQGPLLLSYGERDEVWDSQGACERISERVTCENFVVSYERAGHGVGYPFSLIGVPQTNVMRAYDHRVALGGTALARADAAKDSRTQVLSFLRSYYGHA